MTARSYEFRIANDEAPDRTLLSDKLSSLPCLIARRTFLGTAMAGFAAPAIAQFDRAVLPATNLSWNLADIYPSAAAWDSARRSVLSRLDTLRVPRPVETATALLAVLHLQSDLGRQTERIEAYATLAADADHRDSAAQERSQLAEGLSARADDAGAWIAPAVVGLGRDRVSRYLVESSELSTHFSHYLDGVLRRQPHTLNAQEEALLAGTAQPLGTFENVQSQLISSDIAWPTVKLSNGTKKTLDLQGLNALRTSANRTDRKQAFDEHYAKLATFTDALGANYLGHVQADAFTARSRRYPTSLAMALDADGTPDAVYTTLVQTTDAGLPQAHRYMALRRKLLQLPDIGYWDLSVPLLPGGRTFSLSEMRSLTLQAVQPLGRDYAALLASATAKNWMDPYPRTGKQVGAYMNPGAAYDVHPYLLLNLTDDYQSLSTHAHEWGHAMHTLLANRAQPYDKAQYTNAISEVPSTLNEILLADMMIAQSQSRRDTLIYLGMQINNLWSVYYRQVMLAEFELTVHQKVEAGEGLSGAALSRLYLGLLRKYCGPDVVIPDNYGSAWAEIPHFFNSFYVYKYATCIAAAAAFAVQVRQGTAQRDRYLDALRAGGADYPYLIEKRAGVDLATAAPYAAVNKLMGSLLDRCEALVG
ncbi:M3 family oligoendopeptidase [Sphingomonas sp. UYP23]